MHLGMVALLNVSVAMEDPFTTEGVDGVYCEEVFHEVEQVRLSRPPPWPPPLRVSGARGAAACRLWAETACRAQTGLRWNRPGKRPLRWRPP